MTLIWLLLAQDSTAEAKTLLDALAPAVKDPPYVQLEWEVQPGPSKLVGHFKRGEAWRVDAQLPGGVQITVWDGKGLIIHTKTTRVPHHVDRKPGEPTGMLLTIGGALAEIAYRGNADRLLKDASNVTLTREKLGGIDCTRVTVFKRERNLDFEHHVWIDGQKRCPRYVRKTVIQGRPSELVYTYKVVAPPATREELFSYTPPEPR